MVGRFRAKARANYLRAVCPKDRESEEGNNTMGYVVVSDLSNCKMHVFHFWQRNLTAYQRCFRCQPREAQWANIKFFCQDRESEEGNNTMG